MTRRPLRAKGGALSALVLGLALSACVGMPRPPRGFENDFWGTPLRDCSTATRAHPRFTIMFSVQTPSGHRRPAILVQPRHSQARIEKGRAYSDLELRVDGAPVHVGARGEQFDGMGGYYEFEFDIEPLLRRHPDGFMLELARGRRTVFRADLHGAGWAFGELLRCAAGGAPAMPPR